MENNYNILTGINLIATKQENGNYKVMVTDIDSSKAYTLGEISFIGNIGLFAQHYDVDRVSLDFLTEIVMFLTYLTSLKS